ncbi:MAG: class I SAM-dependent methyltransferase [Geodermatophilaceae bacterium]|nr:class I SAM-dependent methyltransferase [Geodermatophilaceae bacterium]
MAGEDTAGADYAARLQRLETARWKRILDVQAPYRWNIRRLNLGRVLEIGCGIGRNLGHLDGNGIGVDHNADSIAIAQARGLAAFTVADFHASKHAAPAAFDSLLLAHVIEHVGEQQALDIVREYLDYLRPGGRVVFICPQEKGYTTDPTHIRFCGFPELRALAEGLGLGLRRQYSFPLPRIAGRVFPYNEFVVVAAKQ